MQGVVGQCSAFILSQSRRFMWARRCPRVASVVEGRGSVEGRETKAIGAWLVKSQSSTPCGAQGRDLAPSGCLWPWDTGAKMYGKPWVFLKDVGRYAVFF